MNENQMRKLERTLRSQGFRWVREPKWNQLAHDLAVVDFRLAVQKAVWENPALSLEQWVNESQFRADTDVVTYKRQHKDGTTKTDKRGIIPDGYFVIVDEERRARGERHRAKFLLELDMATHANPKFARAKVAAGAAYIKSAQYKARFGDNKGHWLVVTTGPARMGHLMKQVKRAAQHAAELFFFTTLESVKAEDPLISPIWLGVNWSEPGPLIS